jgi:putative flippase GtrA
LKDTQSGLRAIPKSLALNLLKLRANTYDFELDMLVEAKKRGVTIKETTIETVYEDGNPSSHFNPILDSARIYFVFVRFLSVSLLTVLIDYTVFFLSFMGGQSILMSSSLGRLIAFGLNYTLNRRLVFKSTQAQVTTLLKFAGLVIATGLISSTSISLLHEKFDLNIFVAKAFSEGLLYLANFSIQRDIIFRSKTD